MYVAVKRHQQVIFFVAKIMVVAGLYYACGKLGLRLAFLHASASPVWPPTGIMLAVVLLFGYRLWPGIWLGAFLVNLTTVGNVLTSFGIAHGNALEALVGAWLVRRFALGRQAFDRTGDTLKFVLLAAVLSPVISATFGVTSLAWGGFVRWDGYFAVWATWWLGDMVSALILTPLIVLWSAPPPRWNRQKLLEAAGTFALIGLTGWIVFAGESTPPHDQLLPAFLCFPPVLWAAFRLGQRGAIAAAVLLSALAIWGTVHGFGPHAMRDPNASLVLTQAFVATVTLTSLILATAIAGQKRAEAAVQESQARLAGLIDSAMDAVITVDAAQRIMLFNSAAERMFGCGAAAALGQPIDRFIPARFRGTHREHIRKFGQTGETNRHMGALGALSGLRANGEEFPIEASISHMAVGGQKLFTVILRDITERKKVEAELQVWQYELESRVQTRSAELATAHRQLQAEIEERKRLESQIADIVEREQLRLGQELHDGLGQQLTGIAYLMTAHQEKLRKLSPARAREAKRLHEMIRLCIEQTRVLAKGFYPVELERDGLLMALLEVTERPRQPSGITYEVQSDGDPDCATLKGPVAIQLFRIAQEAAHNAAKHSRATRVVIRLAAADGHITLSVRDDGVGLPPDVERTTGMGLRIMQYRARMVGGQIGFQNVPEGGTIVTCSVPRNPRPAAPVVRG